MKTVPCPKCLTENTQDSRYCKSCATPLPGTIDSSASLTRTLERPIQELSPGALFAGRYQIIEDLGQGGMGHVFKALDTRTGEKIAVKVLRPGLEADQRSLERFGHELTAARRISHRNVCRMFDLGEDGGRLYITMEFVPGEDLKSILRMMGAMSPAQAVGIAVQICDGLEEAHRLGVVHRDLKPANILIDKEGHARIMDFGIARSALSRGITDTGTMVGTPDYMSPEQAEGREADARSDLYSLGVMIFEMATGRLPFEGDTPLAIAVKHKTEQPPDPREIAPGLPADLSRVILKCLEKDRSRRYQTAAELRADLDEVAAGLPTGSRVLPRRKPLTSREITVKFPLRRLVWPAAAIVVLAAGAFFLIPILKKTGSDAAAPKVPGSVAVVAFENQTGDPKFDHLRKVIPNLLITNLENTGLFQVATWERIRDVLGQMGRKGVELIDPDSGFDFCRREGVAFIVVGSFTRAGQTFVTEFKLLDAGSRDIVSTAAERGVGEDSILNVLVDEMSRRIAGGMGVAQQKLDATHLAVAEVTTRSAEAYTAYLEGMEELRKLDDAAARPLFEKAVRLDPEFAMAYLQLGRTYEREDIREKWSAIYRRAMELSSRAPEKERLMIAFRYALKIENDRPKAVAIIKDLASRYPKEKDLRLNYGVMIMGSDPDAAIAEFQAALALDPNFGLALNEMAFTLVQKGDYAGAQSYLERYVALAPNEFNARDSLGLLLFMRGRLDESIENYKRARALNPAIGEELSIAYMLALKEDYDGALGWLDKYMVAVGSDAFRSEGPAWQGLIYYLLGRRRLAFERLDAGLALARSSKSSNREFVILVIRGILRCDQGETSRARDDFRQASQLDATAVAAARMMWRVGMICADIADREFAAAAAGLADLDRTLPSNRPSEVDAYLRYFRCLILFGRGDVKAALLEAGQPRVYQILSPGLNFNLPSLAGRNVPVAMDGIALFLAATGRLDAALEEYRLLMTVGPETNRRSLINPLYHLRVAEIYGKKGVKAKAIEHYRKFLALWKDADPGLPEPGQAMARLAALEGR